MRFWAVPWKPTGKDEGTCQGEMSVNELIKKLLLTPERHERPISEGCPLLLWSTGVPGHKDMLCSFKVLGLEGP